MQRDRNCISELTCTGKIQCIACTVPIFWLNGVQFAELSIQLSLICATCNQAQQNHPYEPAVSQTTYTMTNNVKTKDKGKKNLIGILSK